MPVSRQTQIHLLVLFAVLLPAILLRAMNFPSRYAILDMDETGYCQGSLQLIEGITPGNKAAPGGPLYWAGWVYVAGETAWDFVHPTDAERRQAIAIRPFTALDRALFDNYRDTSSLHRAMVMLNLILSLCGCAAAVGLGIRFGSVSAGLLLGGLFAVVPVFLELSEMSRPYSMAWSFGLISLYFAACDDAKGPRWILSAIFLGLSISSRIEMLCLIPLVWWVFWDQHGIRAGKWKLAIVKLTLLSNCVAIVVAPWLVTHLMGNLRTIATVRFGGANSQPWSGALLELLVRQGMGPVILLALAGVLFQSTRNRIRVGLLLVYALLLTISMLRGFADGIHQHGAVLISWMVLIAAETAVLQKRWPKIVPKVWQIALLFPLVQACRLIAFNHSLDDREDSVAWVEQHVPAGTTVYVVDGGTRSLLPTEQASTALWSEVTDDQAWRRKMESGLSRFNLSADELPPALSEENLIQERANRRKWFILGGHTDLPIPRYNVRVVGGSPVFGVHDLDAAMKSQRGVLIWRSGSAVNPPKFLGLPLRRWVSRQGSGVGIYCSPELRGTIRPSNSNDETSKPSNE